MKKLSIHLFSAFLVCMIMATTCDKTDEQFEEECNDTKATLIERTFVPHAKVQYKDYVPYEGKISLSIHKVYCNTNISGEFKKEGVGNAEGFWNPGMQYSYKFENTLDRVVVRFLIDSPFPDINDKVESEIFYYIDVEDYLHEIYKVYDITLPWASDEK